MNGAEAVLTAAATAGIDVCFANPGTTELALVRALDSVSSIRPVLGLVEGVCTGAADGYARMTQKPSLTLLHLGPGVSNGLANLHNARRAGSPIINLIGDHATWHLPVDAPLTSDIAGLADPVSAWVKVAGAADGLVDDFCAAFGEANNGVACLILPTDYQVAEFTSAIASVAMPTRAIVSDAVISQAARALRGAGRNILFMGGTALSRAGLEAAGRIAAATGCVLMHETFPARCERAADLPKPIKLPYLYDQAASALEGVANVILAGAREPVSFFGYPGCSSSFLPSNAKVVALASAPQDSNDDAVDALERLADCVDAPAYRSFDQQGSLVKNVTGSLTPQTFAMVIAAEQPEGAVVVDESITTGFAYHAASMNSPEHTYIVPHVGGAIGDGLPVATGAAIAAGERPVILLEADGSGLYTLQSLWTQAREQLSVTTIICANRRYRILQAEMGEDALTSRAADALLNIDRPQVEWRKIAEGFGVPARQVSDAEELRAALRWSLKEPGPHLIEAIIDVG